MADGPNGARGGAGSLWQTVGKAFEPLRDHPVLAFSLAFGLLIVGGAGVLVTDGADRVVAATVLAALLLVYLSGLLAARGTGGTDGIGGTGRTPGADDDAGAAQAAAPPRTQYDGLTLDIGNRNTFSAENSLNRGKGRISVGKRNKVTLTGSGNDPAESDEQPPPGRLPKGETS
ncbi:hypothetical protein KGQ19_09580 [Catenulispora sp. NL8]|uniref:Uncharacterized protein n=1 Tax=Catenulispora pinistramenti TaxID=2705254 RepID=A0ABS5KM72_9ACTN|nr:hypothetical protein [Catenulispora pinistramenti]MBS2547121.1 hypothetical protein [Catenulispora pinistramenti]